MEAQRATRKVRFNDLQGLQRAQVYVMMAQQSKPVPEWVEVYSDNGKVKSLLPSNNKRF